MKKFKKIFAVLLTLAMVLGMSMTSFAAPITGGSVEVTGLSTAGEQKVTVYNIYHLKDNNNEWEISDWAKNIVSTPDDLKNADKLAQLKDAVPTSNDGEARSSNGKATISNLVAGAYLVIATDTLNKTTYNPMVAVTYEYNTNNLMVAKKAEVVAKASSYSLEKGQDDGDAVVEVGDLIKYTIKTTVPYVTSTTTGDTTTTSPTEFKVKDTITGATYYLTGSDVKGVKAESSVTVGGKNVTGISIPEDANNGTSFEIDMSSLLANNDYAGKEVVISYTAKVNAVDTITNKAQSTNVPETMEEGKEITTTAYTGQLTITKYGELPKPNEVESETNVRPTLSGATFKVYRVVEGKTEYAKISNGYITGEWTENEADAGTITTGTDGTATVKGLNVGTYKFKETVAPDGYSINTTDSEGTITKTDNAGVVSVNGTARMDDTKLSSLPSTGGIGTTIFTIGGCAIMIIAAALFFASRRKAAK